jgi:hypothetical protein
MDLGTRQRLVAARRRGQLSAGVVSTEVVPAASKEGWQSTGGVRCVVFVDEVRGRLGQLHLRNHCQDDFAGQLVALLPDWTSWLAARNGTAPHLAERCRPYALGESHVDVGSDDSMPNYLARVSE